MEFVGNPTESQRLVNQSQMFKAMGKAVANGLRVGMPGVIESFDEVKQTCTVDLCIYERTLINGVVSDVKIPTLLDVPLVVPRGGGTALTFPVQPGDECFVIFADMCINEWFDAGGINNVQQKLRRHSLSDGFAILAPSSQPKVLPNYSTDAAELRTEDGETSVSVSQDGIAITASTITLDGEVKFTGTLVPSVSSPSKSLLVSVGGVAYYLKLSATP